MASNVSTNVNVKVKATGGARAAKDVGAVKDALTRLGASTEDASTKAVQLNRNTIYFKS